MANRRQRNWKGQFQRFSFIAKNPSEEGEIAWNAYQYYEDGSIVEWVGAEDSETPHATTKIVKESSKSATGSHGEVVAERRTQQGIQAVLEIIRFYYGPQ